MLCPVQGDGQECELRNHVDLPGQPPAASPHPSLRLCKITGGPDWWCMVWVKVRVLVGRLARIKFPVSSNSCCEFSGFSLLPVKYFQLPVLVTRVVLFYLLNISWK